MHAFEDVKGLVDAEKAFSRPEVRMVAVVKACYKLGKLFLKLCGLGQWAGLWLCLSLPSVEMLGAIWFGLMRPGFLAAEGANVAVRLFLAIGFGLKGAVEFVTQLLGFGGVTPTVLGRLG